MPKVIYDNSNLAESYSGPTSPLTFSFARFVYEKVYIEFCSLMGVRKSVILENQKMFENMIEFIGFRLYYNLINWYKLVSFLPGYRFNRQFFEKMLGVEKTYIYHMKEKNKYFDFLFFSWQLVKIGLIFINMKHLIEKFNKQFDQNYKKINRINLERLSSEQIKDLYFDTVDRLAIGIWKIPIANDLAVMISTGILDKISRKWLSDENYAKRLMALSHKNLISLDPGFELIRLAKIIKKSKKLFIIFQTNPPKNIISKLRKKEYIYCQYIRIKSER